MDAVLVIGATGILAPAADALVVRGDNVLAVARNATRLRTLSRHHEHARGHLATLAADAAEPSFAHVLHAYLAETGTTLSAALVYRPATSEIVLEELGGIVNGTLVEILTSRAVAPPEDGREWSTDMLPPVGGERTRLVLGWWADARSTRWHDADEVSAAAVSTLRDPHDRVLGTLSPWSRRP